MFEPILRQAMDGGVSWGNVELPSAYGSEKVAALEGGFFATAVASMILRGEAIDPAAVTEGTGLPRKGTGGLRGSLGPGVMARVIGSTIEIDAAAAADPWIIPSGRVLDASGRQVADLAALPWGEAVWRFRWVDRDATGASAASGVYFIVLDRGGYRAGTKRTLFR